MTSSQGDTSILKTIDGLVAEEHELRSRSLTEHGLDEEGRNRLKSVETQLDQCWDLLRQRRAKSEFGQNPDEAHVRPAGEVEGYLG
ncbi:hypothetical protein M2163_001229 [Streptomyces sp. SAI-135]|uniref:DUF2630 family protein n=1 Tax=unclassified Streptomyces TaxID=2593676 RepID=UPI002474D3B8|nr:MULTISPECIES: DUF2630 family protein [unclassified Streptomyces]MDH6521779.1 hypothetical protein [Streptomyces sp. SAI-090]MDH6554070.1 hypothetical protein [Streptomyces sp. SAI-041]MDH6573147.1 hypothetical protein [Streptomyces sp. SAI-117]MDH6581864.1 hypothetical protein [Streptomyces sp. SAI-133]MDH6614121.1 hypothetical protein [Streptomyces sp. SAI-135]